MFSAYANENLKEGNYLFDKAESFLTSNPDSTLYYLSKLENEYVLSIEEEAQLLFLKGNAFTEKKEYDLSNKLYAQARSITKDEELAATICLGEAINSLFKNELLIGVEKIMCALAFFEKHGNKYNDRLLRCYSNLGFVKKRLGKADEALEYFEKAIAITEENTRPYFTLKVNIGSVYIHQKDFEKSNKLNKELISLLKDKDFENILSAAYSNLCVGYLELGETDKALFYAKESVNTLKTESSLRILGGTFFKKEMYDSSLVYLLQVQDAADGKTRKEVLEEIAFCYEKQNESILANEFLRKRIHVGDSLAKDELERKIESELAPYESRKKEQQISQLSQEKSDTLLRLKLQQILLAVSLFCFLLLALIGVGYYNYQKQQQDLKSANIQNKLLRSQLNPHFLFHSLQNIQNFIYQNEKEKSLKYLKNYSRLIRSVFDSSEDDFITIEEDSNTVKDYIALQHLNYEHSFKVDFFVDETVKDYSIPPLIVQPFVENAIIHGLKEDGNGCLKVHYLDVGDDVSIIIEDNGTDAGKATANLKFNKYSSTQVIQKRVEQLAKGYGFKLNIVKTNIGKGLQVIITFDKTIKI